MYSSDDRRTARALPWALDEFDLPDRFRSLSGDARLDDELEQVEIAHAPDVAAMQADVYAQGYADGERAQRAESEATIASALMALTDAIERVNLHEAPWTANAEENLAAMAVVVARHVIEREVTVDEQIVSDLVRRALLHFPLDQTISIRLHPEDIAACEPLLTSAAGDRLRDLRLVVDPNVQRGGCLVEGRERVIDGRVDTSLERAYRSLGQILA